MANSAKCDHCGAVYKNIPENAFGKTVNCKKCGEKFIVKQLETGTPARPAAPATLAYEAPQDNKRDDKGRKESAPASSKFAAKTIAHETRESSSSAAATLPYAPAYDKGEKGISPSSPVSAAGTIPYPAAPEPAPVAGTAPFPPEISRQETERSPEKPASRIDEAAPAWTPGETVLGLYQVKEVFEAGAMGAVYRVRHTGWDLDLAVKRPRRETLARAGGAENFEREAETWVNLGLHPNIVNCHYVRRIDGIPHVFAEFMDGGDLSSWIEEGRLYEGGPDKALERMLDIAVQFARGLSHAHDRGIVHQDVKPGNLMLARDGVARVTDFGLASAAPSEDAGAKAKGATVFVDGKGLTLEYASPEQFDGKPLTRRSDLWSWGLSVLEMFAGELSWQAGPAAPMALAGYIETGPPDETIPQMPQALAEFLGSCFRENPEERPRGMREAEAVLVEIHESRFGKPYGRPRPKPQEDLAEGLNNRALSLLDLGRKEEALSLWREALRNRPHHPESTYNLGLVRWRAGEIDDRDLVEEMNEVSKSHPDNWLDEYLLGLVHLERGDCASAISVLESISGEDSDREEVREALKTARELEPRSWKLMGEPTASIQNFGQTAACLDDDSLIAAVSIGFERDLKRFDPNSGKVLNTYSCDDCVRDWITAVFASAEQDLIVSGTKKGKILLHEKSTGRQIGGFSGHEGEIAAVGLVDQGKIVVAGAGYSNRRESETVGIWDSTTGKKLREFGGRTGRVLSLHPLSNGRDVLVFKNDSVAAWDWTTGERAIEYRNVGEISCGAISPDEGAILACEGIRADQGAFKVWKSGEASPVCSFSHGKAAFHAEFVSDDRFVLVAHDGGLLRIWDVKEKRCLTTIPAHEPVIKKAMVFRDGKRAVSAGGEMSRSVKLWRLGERYLCEAPLIVSRVSIYERTAKARNEFESFMEAAENAVRNGDVARAASLVGSARSVPGHERHERALGIWSGLYRKLPKTNLKGAWETQSMRNDGPGQTPMRVSGDADRAVVREKKDHVGFKLVEPKSGKILTLFKTEFAGVRRLALSRDCRLVLSGDHARVQLWDAETGGLVWTFEANENPPQVLSVCFGIDGRFAVTGGRDRTVRLWEVASGRCLRAFDAGAARKSVGSHAGAVLAVAWSPDMKTLLTAQNMEPFKLWDLEKLSLAKEWEISCGEGAAGPELPYGPDIASFDATGRFALVCGTKDNAFKMVRTETGEVVKTFEGHEGVVRSAVLGFDGRCALSGSDDATVRLWNVETGECLRVFEAHSKPVEKVALSKDGSLAVSEDRSGVMKTWFLDWELDDAGIASWNERADAFVDNFLHRRSPYAGELPSDRDPTEEELKKALSKSGEPVWSDADFRELVEELGCAGLGFVSAETVRKKLEKYNAARIRRRIEDFERELLPFFSSISSDRTQCSIALKTACESLKKTVDWSFSDETENTARLPELCVRMVRLLDGLKGEKERG